MKVSTRATSKVLRVVAAAALAGIFGTFSDKTSAADYPRRPIQLVVGFAPGGGTDLAARMLADWLSKRLGQRVVIENRSGTGGNLAAQMVINSPPDGYTLLFAGPNHVISGSLYKKLPFDFLRDTVPVAGVMRLANLMTVPNALPVHNVRGFIEYARANRGKISMASTGHGTSVHLSGELFKAMTKVEMIHVPYRGAASAYPDLITGKVDVMFGNLTGSIEYVNRGQLRALGVTSVKRWEGLSGIPTIAETVPGYEADVWYGVVAPKGTPPEIVSTLNKGISAALADPALAARFVSAGGVPMPMSSAEFGKWTADEYAKWRKVVEFAGISVD
jgi:tripartite-type tricarboxylate transporter receptor subunit TctC